MIYFTLLRVHVTFWKNVCTTAQSSKKYYKAFSLPVFSIGPLVRTHSKNEVTPKGGRDGGSNKSVIRLKTFLEVSTKFENTNSLLFSVLPLHIHLQSISNREERIPLLRVIIGVIITQWLLPFSL